MCIFATIKTDVLFLSILLRDFGVRMGRASENELNACILNSTHKNWSRDSSVGVVTGYGLDNRGSGVRFPAEAENFSLHHRVQNCSGTHPVSYPMGTWGSFPGGKATGVWS
jgi:hypothetical protein